MRGTTVAVIRTFTWTRLRILTFRGTLLVIFSRTAAKVLLNYVVFGVAIESIADARVLLCNRAKYIGRSLIG